MVNSKADGKLFRKGIPTINEHIKNMFKERELDQNSVIRNFRITAADGKNYETSFYNLDVIISVGYRVKSKEGVLFRKWATQVLKNHILNGYTLNKDRLKELKNLYHCLTDTLTITTMNINRLRIDSARQKDFALLAEDVERIKQDIGNFKKKLL